MLSRTSITGWTSTTAIRLGLASPFRSPPHPLTLKYSDFPRCVSFPILRQRCFRQRATLTLQQNQDRDVTPSRIASSFCFSSTQTRSCSSVPALPLVSPAVGVILQAGTYWPCDSGPALAQCTSVRGPTSVRRPSIFMMIRTTRLS